MQYFSVQGIKNPKEKIMKVLQRYEKRSGQLINLSKSFMYLHENVPLIDKERFRSLTGITLLSLLLDIQFFMVDKRRSILGR